MIIGLTGFSGSGKTTVSQVFAEQGFFVVDCDRIVHEEVYQKPKVLDAIAAAFGQECIEEGKLNRTVLRSKTMGNPQETMRLNQTVLPLIAEHIQSILEQNTHRPILLDAPTLFESGLQAQCHKILCVITSPDVAVKRIMERDHLSEEDAKKRLSSQHPASFYTERSDFTILNDGDLDHLRAQTKKIIEVLHE